MCRLGCQLRVCKKAERTESIGNGHNHDAALCELVAPVQRHRCRSVCIAAAVNPDHDGQAFIRCLGRGPDVQIQAVLTRRRRLLPGHRDTLLHARRCERDRLARAFPGHDRLRFAPAQLANGWGGERHTHIYRESVLRDAFDSTRFDPRRFCPRARRNQAQRARHSPSTPPVRHRPSPLGARSQSGVGGAVEIDRGVPDSERFVTKGPVEEG